MGVEADSALSSRRELRSARGKQIGLLKLRQTGSHGAGPLQKTEQRRISSEEFLALK